MANIVLRNERFDLLDFESEEEFEKAVIENSKYLFGKDSVYIDVKKQVGKKDSYNKGVPDGYLIDFASAKQPQLYLVENELSTHDVYAHISEQLLRFSTAIKNPSNQMRTKLVEIIKSDGKLLGLINSFLKETPFSNVDELINFVVDRQIKIVLVIDEVTADLNDSLDVFRDRPDVVSLKRFNCRNKIAYVYEPMREELQEFESRRRTARESKELDFDTIVCPAFDEGFRHAYIKNNAWWEIRISQKAREKLRYIAIYEKAPAAMIQHYAEIERIAPYKKSGKFIVHVKNKKTIRPIELDRGKKGIAPQSPRFTTLEKLLKAKKISDLWK